MAATMEIDEENPSVNTIAARAGVGVASLYRYFPSKAAIYAEISRRLQRDFLDQLRALLSQPSLGLEETVLECCRIAVEVPGVSPVLRRNLNLLVPLSWSKDTADTMLVAAVAEIARWLRMRMDSPPADLEDRVFMVFAAGRGIVMLSRLYPDAAPNDRDLVRHMARVTLMYMRS